jgi:malonyl CoA-acyl carrier protein transacylase
MSVVYDLIVVLHLLGMAAIVGGWFASLRGFTALEVMVNGARAQIATGLILVGLAESVHSLDKHLNHAAVGVKLVVALAAVACLEIARARARRGEDPRTLVTAGGALGALNVVVAALWL